MNNTPMNSSSTATFQGFGLAPEIQKTLQACGFERPTEIQEKAIPLLLAADRIDFHGQAQTGTGKTLAFGLPLLHRINRTEKRVQALVVVPTRELAVQICESLRPLASAIGISLEPIYGGASMELQLQKLHRGVHVVVGTPGRILDHLQRGSLNADYARTLVLDEADIMLDMGFKDDIDLILNELPESREIWLFSATVKSGIYTILKAHMKNHTSVRVNSTEIATTKTKHYFCVTPPQSRLAALCRFIECNPDFYGFIFCQTKVLAGQIAEQLLTRGYRVGALHGDLSQAQRNIIIKRFKTRKDLNIVVATDVAARGIDIPQLSHVVNYSFPDDHESYVHRSGRTGRAGCDGVAITFISKHEMRIVRDMQRKFNIEMEPINVPDHSTMINVRVEMIKTYLNKLNEQTAHAVCTDLVNGLSDEACRQALSHALYDMFIKQIDDREQFAQTPNLSQDSDHAPLTEISINVGSDDNVQREDITAVMERSPQVTLEAVTKIRVLKRCTFIHTTPDQLNHCIQALNGTTMGGRTVRATQVQALAEKNHERGGGRNNHRNNNRHKKYDNTRKGYNSRDNHHGGWSHDRHENRHEGRSGGFSHRNHSQKRREGGRYGANRPELYQADAGKNHDRGQIL